MRQAAFYLFSLLFVLTLGTSCEKDNSDLKPPKTEIPDDFVGKWIIGNVNPARFADYNGTRQNDMRNTIAYELKKDGSAQQYIYIYEENDDKQTLTYRRGTVTFDAATATLKFNPTEGWYHIFEGGRKTEGNMEPGGLFPTYAPKYRNCALDRENNATFLVGVNDYNETVGFAKANW